MAVAAGYNHSIIYVTTDGTLWAMGYNGYGQLGNGTVININLPVSVTSNVVAVAGGQMHSLLRQEVMGRCGQWVATLRAVR